jgi:hypothetical protein
MTGTRAWPVVWLAGMPVMRRSLNAPGSISVRSAGGSTPLSTPTMNPAPSWVELGMLAGGEVPRVSAGGVDPTFRSLTTRGTPGAGTTEPSARTVPGSVLWRVRVTFGVGVVWRTVAEGTWGIPTPPLLPLGPTTIVSRRK